MNRLGEFPSKQIRALLHRSRVAADAFEYFFQFLRCTGQSVERQRAFVSGAGGLRFESRAGQIGHSVANVLLTLRYFFEGSCVARAQ